MTVKVKLPTKGQLVIPRAVRKRHRWDAGTVLVLEDRGDRIVMREALALPETKLEDVIGCTGYRGRRRSLKEMEAAIARGAREGLQ